MWFIMIGVFVFVLAVWFLKNIAKQRDIYDKLFDELDGDDDCDQTQLQ